MRFTGTKSIGIRAPIIHDGDDIVSITVESLKNACESGEITLQNKDVVALTESIVARAQGNYVTVDDVALSIQNVLFENGMSKQDRELAVVFPIMSRNRFSIILKGIARACGKVTVVLKVPDDEMGNILIPQSLFSLDDFKKKKYITGEQAHKKYGKSLIHKFTGVDYIDLYTSIIQSESCSANIILAANPLVALKFSSNIICADIHTVKQTKQTLVNATHKDLNICDLSDICKCAVREGAGFNEYFGLYGSNKMSEEKLKLFPRNCSDIANEIQYAIKEEFNKKVEVLIYGDGAFKDPVCGIWELADPVVGAGYTIGLVGTPNELKLKYLADNDFSDKTGEQATKAIKKAIKNKYKNLIGTMETQGTTPRNYTDLIGSLCDLTSGSGDKGTPIVLVQGYFDNYADN